MKKNIMSSPGNYICPMNTEKQGEDELNTVIKEKCRELAVLYKIDEIHDHSKNLQQFLDLTVMEIIRLLMVKSCLILLKNKKTGLLEIKSLNKHSNRLLNDDSSTEIIKMAVHCLAKRKQVIFTGAENFQCIGIKQGTVLAAPLFSGKEGNSPIGAIIVVKGKGSSFSEADREMMHAIITQTDSAIIHMQLLGEMDHKIRTLEIINAVDSVRDGTKNTQEMMARVLEMIHRYIPTEVSAAVVRNERTGKDEIVALTDRAKSKCSKKLIQEMADTCMRSMKDCPGQASGGFIRNSYVMPIIFGENKVFGSIVLINKKEGFSDLDIELLHSAEDQIDSALEHMRVFNNLVLRNKELDLLYTIDRIRDTIKNFDGMVTAILAEFASALDAETGFVELLDEEGKEKEVRTIGVPIPNYKRKIMIISKEAIKKSKLLSIANRNGIRSCVCIPLILGESIIGTFGVINPKNKEYFDADDERFLSAVASQADTAIFEDISKQKIKSVFKRYVNENVVDQMLKLNKAEFLKGQRLDMTVTFADIRGFTSMSEKLQNPEELVLVINEYLSAMTDVVMEHDGTLDKFVGDEVMALFGAPIHYPDHAKKAIETAIDMQKAMRKLRKKWSRERKLPCRIGIGINSGEMVAGNIGCEKMSDYTVLGDNVNIGARLCSAAQGDEIIVSEKTYLKTKEYFRFEKLEPIHVKGKQKPLLIYKILY
jgi:class 3 adenylate cyclase